MLAGLIETANTVAALMLAEIRYPGRNLGDWRNAQVSTLYTQPYMWVRILKTAEAVSAEKYPAMNAKDAKPIAIHAGNCKTIAIQHLLRFAYPTKQVQPDSNGELVLLMDNITARIVADIARLIQHVWSTQLTEGSEQPIAMQIRAPPGLPISLKSILEVDAPANAYIPLTPDDLYSM
jgi:hypothetical protein